MIILNQNRDIMVNMDNITTIERNGHKICCFFRDSPCPQPLGDYPTDARAQEVLKTIFEVFNNPFMVDKHNTYDTIHSYLKTYEMPEV